MDSLMKMWLISFPSPLLCFYHFSKDLSRMTYVKEKFGDIAYKNHFLQLSQLQVLFLGKNTVFPFTVTCCLLKALYSYKFNSIHCSHAEIFQWVLKGNFTYGQTSLIYLVSCDFIFAGEKWDTKTEAINLIIKHDDSQNLLAGIHISYEYFPCSPNLWIFLRQVSGKIKRICC